MNKKGFFIIFNKWYFIIVGILLLLFLAYSSLNNSGYIKEDSTAYTIGKTLGLQSPDSVLIEQKIFESVNQERINHGLNALVWDNQLALIAREHSEDMYKRDFFDHNNPDGDGPTERAENNGIRITNGNWIGIAENIGQTPIGDVIGCGYTHSEEEITNCAMDGWMNSPGHRENILNSNYDVIGIGTYCTTSACWNTQDFR
ncbi:MAG: CAP domain-containing protein [Candidatus Nanoarchaeia archaeon]|nr:CAP domain-containing protein [Candidatus Nanoarchaeia archaeon]MDD5357633.1 CAP domain-containing protein [Candidatus Nanoarchaeia archaeon]MDD5588552.1 CAP domain-containing protein [Candidatus Nanoarchaeia archaeon]